MPEYTNRRPASDAGLRFSLRCNVNEYKYKTEMHCHTEYVSKFCATVDAESIAEQYISFGYTTVVITDHLNARTFTHPDAEGLTPAEKMRYFTEGIRRVKEYAGNRLNVLAGAEICFPQNGSDYLIYGLDEGFFLENTEMYLKDRFSVSSLVRNCGGVFIQAHPFRCGCAVTEENVIDGIEVYNGHPNQHNHNVISEHWAKLYPRYILTSGSDHHDEPCYPDAGILTKVPVTNEKQLAEILRSGDYELVRDEETRKKGKIDLMAWLKTL